VVSPGEVLVLIKKNGSRSLPNDQIVVPRPSDLNRDSAAYKQWDKEYGDCNGILEQVYLPGTYFNFSPFDYERIIVKLSEMVELAAGDIIMTGTPSGVAATVPGDKLECEIEAVGRLTVTIRPPAA
jgi:hypothetical protein